MISYAILFLSITALLGLSLVFLGIRYHRGSLALGLGHAAMALTGLGFLGAQIINGPINKYNNGAALILTLALIGGLMLFALRESNKPPSMIVVAIHAIFALTGIGILLLGQA